MLIREIEYENYLTGETGVLEVKIHYPVSNELPEEEWMCKYSISFSDEIETGEVYGIDAIQAILLCIKKIAVLLEYYQRVKRIKLTWLGMNDLGFSFQ